MDCEGKKLKSRVVLRLCVVSACGGRAGGFGGLAKLDRTAGGPMSLPPRDRM